LNEGEDKTAAHPTADDATHGHCLTAGQPCGHTPIDSTDLDDEVTDVSH
jgi:hypothetical protein